MVTPPQYGVDAGTGGLDVDLVAAPAIPQDAPEMILETIPKEVLLPDVKEDEFIESFKVLPEQKPEELSRKEAAAPQPAPVYGDGSSPISGLDPTTMSSSSGAVSKATPKYRRNPAPRYPLLSRKKGEEGLVLLLVDVDSFGKVKSVVMKKTSGYSALDESAIKAVERWRFEPAKIGGVSLDATVEVPIRFQLEDA